MARSIILLLALTAPTTGLWINAAGEEVTKPCPSALQMSDRARLPQGCVAHVPGVWLSRDTFKEGELERVKLRAELDKAAAREKVLSQRIADLELQVTLVAVEQVCPACNCYTEIITTTSLAIGGCALWTLSR